MLLVRCILHHPMGENNTKISIICIKIIIINVYISIKQLFINKQYTVFLMWGLCSQSGVAEDKSFLDWYTTSACSYWYSKESLCFYIWGQAVYTFLGLFDSEDKALWFFETYVFTSSHNVTIQNKLTWFDIL